MGKGFNENLLKRFLKRKMKFTLGLMVAFLITGTVGFAESIEEHNNPFKEAFENLAGLGTGLKAESINNVIIENNGTESVIRKADGTVLGEIDNLLISKTLSGNVSTALNSTEVKEGVNNGVLEKTDEYKGTNEQINNGIIITSGVGQKSSSASSVKNNGIIIVSDAGQTGNLVINNGYIKAGGKGQIALNTYNYGVISANAIGQNAHWVADTAHHFNYGIIKDSGTGQSGDKYDSTGNTVSKNYGIIIGGQNGQVNTKVKDEIYNYGYIDVKDKGMKADTGTGYNYGVVKVSNAVNAFSGNITNKGIVIADTGTLAEQYNTGILLDSSYNAIGDDVKVFNEGDIVQNFGEDKKDSFEGKDKGFVKNQSVEIDNVQSKVIGAVVTDNSKLTDGAVFNYTDEEKDLFLKDTSLVGYFEQDGTLLKVDGNLTLGAGTNITAVKNNMELDVTAVDITGEEITIADDAKINGIIKGEGDINFADTKGNYTLGDTGLVNITVTDNSNENLKYVEIVLEAGKELAKEDDNNQTDKVGSTIEGIKLSTENTGEGLINKVTIRDGLEIKADEIDVDGKKYSIYDENTGNGNTQLEMIVEDMADVKGNILLGAGKDNFTTNAVGKDEYMGTIDLGAGEDKFIVNGVNTENEFAFNVENAESVELNGGKWNITGGSIKFSDVSREAGKPEINLTNGAELNITLNQNGSNLADVIEGEFIEEGEKLSLKTEDGKIRYQIDVNTGLNFDKLNTDRYVIDNTANVIAPVFNVTSDKNGTYVSLKTVEQLGLESYYSSIYEAYIRQLAGKNTTLITHINEMKSDSDLAEEIRGLHITAKAYYTAGTVVTKNITDAYLSAVEEFGERARKGEWIAQGKFINSDTEFDGGSVVKGYDGDMNSAVAMVEYGVSDDTSYGIAFGGGDTEIDINGGGKLDGDNYYVGLYTKFRTENGIDVVGNFGIMKSDLDSKLGNEFAFTTSGVNVSDSGYEEGTADSTAFALSLRGKKDINITEAVKVQPVLGARMTLINQDKAENPGMNFEIKEQDVFVAEGIVGIHGAKEFALEQGIFEINTGIEYAFSASTNNEDAEYTIFDTDNIEIENGDIPSSKGTFHIGADYEHENGVGINGKYETMWSDSGDDSRITAGVSYRF